MNDGYTTNDPMWIRAFGRSPNTSSVVREGILAEDVTVAEFPDDLVEDGKILIDAWCVDIHVGPGERGAVEDNLDNDSNVLMHYPL